MEADHGPDRILPTYLPPMRAYVGKKMEGSKGNQKLKNGDHEGRMH
jgi:hypothetical protein